MVEFLQILHRALVAGIVGDRQLEVGVGRHDLVVLLERQDPPRVRQRMDHHRRVLAGFDNFVEVANRAVSNRQGQRTIVPDRSTWLQQVSAGKVRGGHILVRGDGHQRLAQAPCHVFDKPRFAAAGRSLQHDRQAFGKGGLEHRDLVADRLIEGFRNNPIGIEIHVHSPRLVRGEAARQREDFLPSASGFGKHRLMRALQPRSAQAGVCKRLGVH